MFNKRYIFKFLILIIPVFILFTGCLPQNIEESNNIISPQNKLCPIKGTWKIENLTKIDDNNSEIKNKNIESFLKQTIAFDKDSFFFLNETFNEVQYKVKSVNTYEYFLYNHKINPEKLNLDDKDIFVISVFSKQNLFYDFIKVSDNQLLLFTNDIFFHLTKISDSIDIKKDFSKENTFFSNNKEDYIKNTSALKSGVMLGLKNSEIIDGIPISSYKTLWIALESNYLHSILSRSDLFVPRKSGFWNLGIKHEQHEGFMQDTIYAYSIDGEKKNSETFNISPYIGGNILRNILFVGNDYVATQYSTFLKNNSVIPPCRFQVLPIDNLSNMSGVKISDLTGEDGKKVFFNSAKTFAASQTEETLKNSSNTKEDLFSVSRRNGNWIMQGQLDLNYGEIAKSIFNINILPPKKLLNYDELHISWNTIKSKIPEALDAFTSPTEDLALIITKNFIYIYGMKNKNLSDKPLTKIKIKETESIVMAEWASGTYVDKWETSFIAHGALHLSTD